MHVHADTLLTHPPEVVDAAGVTDSKLPEVSEVQQRVVQGPGGARVARGVQVEGGIGQREALEPVEGG